MAKQHLSAFILGQINCLLGCRVPCQNFTWFDKRFDRPQSAEELLNLMLKMLA